MIMIMSCNKNLRIVRHKSGQNRIARLTIIGLLPVNQVALSPLKPREWAAA